MKKLQAFFTLLIVIGMVMLLGRIVTGILEYVDISFISFFTDYRVESYIILVIGVLGELIIKRKKVN